MFYMPATKHQVRGNTLEASCSEALPCNTSAHLLRGCNAIQNAMPGCLKPTLLTVMQDNNKLLYMAEPKPQIL